MAIFIQFLLAFPINDSFLRQKCQADFLGTQIGRSLTGWMAYIPDVSEKQKRNLIS